jgi:hypothetical protein
MTEQDIKHLQNIINNILVYPIGGDHVQITAVLKKHDLDLLQKISKL